MTDAALRQLHRSKTGLKPPAEPKRPAPKAQIEARIREELDEAARVERMLEELGSRPVQ